jgi:hypothetical protein
MQDYIEDLIEASEIEYLSDLDDGYLEDAEEQIL